MRKNGKWIDNIVLAVVLTGSMALAQTPETAQKDPAQPPQVRCTGKVVDGQGQPLAGAQVELHNLSLDENVYSIEVKKAKEAITGNDGAFSFATAREESNQAGQSVILAQKEGFSIGWANWYRRDNLETTITLGQPADLAGRVVDEAGQPVAGAQVGIAFLLVNVNNEPRYMIQKISKKLLTAVTDPEGGFVFKRLPAEATAEFAVEKAGRATVNTFQPGNNQGNVLQFKPGQKDIKIVQPLEAIIEGQVVEKDGGKPAAGIRLAARQEQNMTPFGPDPVLSDAEGRFRLNGLTAGPWTLSIAPSKEALTEWVGVPVEVIAEAGKTSEGVKIELSKGGVIEVKVTDERTKQPVPKANVVIDPAEGGRSLYILSGPQGLARLRVLPGQYRLSGVYMQGGGIMQQDEAITVEDGKTASLECELAGPTMIAGVVKDEAGQPVEGAQVNVYPMGRKETLTDKEGRYEVEWNPGEWGGNQPTVYYLVARHKQRNLAGAVEIQKDTKTADLTLKPGIIFSGKVVDPNGQALAKAAITVMLRAGSWGAILRRETCSTGEEGTFEVQAIPAEMKYQLYATAEGYGNTLKEVHAKEAVNGRLDAGTLVLKPANLTLTGVVVDAEDKPVAGADIYGQGDGQPDLHNIKTDEQGKFTLKVCEGKLNIQAHVQGAKRLRGNIETEGGVAEVKIVVSESSSGGQRFVPKEPASLVGKPLPDMAALSLAVDPVATKDHPVLLCFCDMNQRPSRHCVQELVKKVDELKTKGVFVALVQAEPMEQKDLDQWITKYQIPFPCGLMKDQPDKTKFAWGIKALPWLLLTDKQHMVQAEGFAIDKLAEEVGEIPD